jgi:hypothetical protein
VLLPFRQPQEGSLSQAVLLVKLTNACDQPTKRPADDGEICWSKSQCVVITYCVVIKVPDYEAIIPEEVWVVKSDFLSDHNH